VGITTEIFPFFLVLDLELNLVADLAYVLGASVAASFIFLYKSPPSDFSLIQGNYYLCVYFGCHWRVLHRDTIKAVVSATFLSVMLDAAKICSTSLSSFGILSRTMYMGNSDVVAVSSSSVLQKVSERMKIYKWQNVIFVHAPTFFSSHARY